MKFFLILFLFLSTIEIQGTDELTVQDIIELRKLLFKGINSDCPEIVKTILESGLSPNITDDQGYSALVHSVYMQKYNCFEVLLSQKADPSLLGPFNETLLIVSSANYNRLFRKILFHREAFGIDINATNKKGMTALMVAAQHNQAEAILALAAAGAKLNLRNLDQQTALHIAAENGFYKTIKALVTAGAKVDLKDAKGRTAAAIIKENYHKLDHDLRYPPKSEEDRIIFLHRDTFKIMEESYRFLQTHASSQSLCN